ncbi:hypothetical protein CJ030_MR6G021572 [Morella rubra]|uniref:Uncharacterized protein n=1 Tax=Morella rubra TaxID=262757 RepID=A0A6A1VHF3_9ROSI|nr:hypothetical protein CJ030_MR6G021572 [Morella rubra]
MYWLRLGSLRYPQRQGLCSLILRQHKLEGGVKVVIAGMHTFISMGLHVTAFAVCASLKSTANTTMANRAAKGTVFIFNFFNRRREKEREGDYGAFGQGGVTFIDVG